MIINEKKLSELERNIFTIKIITKVSRFFVNDEINKDISERWLYTEEMYGSLNRYLSLYESTNEDEYKNYLENNYSTVIELVEEQKSILYNKYSLSTLVFLENIKRPIREGFISSLNRIITQFSNPNDLADYIYYHGSKDLNLIIDFILTQDISFNYLTLFKQIKENSRITYSKDEWINIGTKLNSCLIELKTRNIESQELTNWINKLTAYRFLLTLFN